MIYKHKKEFASVFNDKKRKQAKDPTEQLRQSFATQLNICIKRAYAGKTPSYAVIARDYALRSKSGDHVSAETIRKWMHGISVPQSSRLRTLIPWLGFELAEVLDLVTEQTMPNSSDSGHLKPYDGSNHSSYAGGYDADDYLEMRILTLIKKLSKRDRNMVLSILETLRQSRGYSNEQT